MLQAIGRALGLELEVVPGPDRFNWPLAADDNAAAERAPEAYQALQGFLRKRLDARGYRVLLVFGNQCRALFEAAEIDRFTPAGASIIHTHSLGAMLQVPALKKTVWEDIRIVPELLKQ